MNVRINHLLDEALHLPVEERSALLAALLDSLDGAEATAVSEAWKAEVARRRGALRDGTTEALSWNEVKATLQSL